MAIGIASTNKFHIGQAELRIGPMSSANKLKQANSLGLLQSSIVRFTQESADLEAGLPKTLQDTAITRTVVTIEAQAYEYSRKNIRVMINEGAETAGSVTEYAGTAAETATATTVGTTDFDTTIPLADVTVGDLLVIYPAANPENVSVVRVTAKTAAAVPANANVQIDNTKTPLLFNVAVGDIIFKANQIGLGNSTATNYFSAQVLGLEHATGRPVGFNFWKCAFQGGLEYSFSADNFAVTPITLKVLQPAASEWASGGSLEHLADLLPTHPYGMYIGG